jgi:hypothetical protein
MIIIRIILIIIKKSFVINMFKLSFNCLCDGYSLFFLLSIGRFLQTEIQISRTSLRGAPHMLQSRDISCAPEGRMGKGFRGTEFLLRNPNSEAWVSITPPRISTADINLLTQNVPKMSIFLLRDFAPFEETVDTRLVDRIRAMQWWRIGSGGPRHGQHVRLT